MKPNSLQSILDMQREKKDSRLKAKGLPEEKEKKEIRKIPDKPASRENTVLIGGHFHRTILKQLKLIAVEEETTNQLLIKEALDLLFVKKGKKSIDEL